MTDQEINIAIAEACGWKSSWNGNVNMWHNPSGTPIGFIPNYSTDLNAMHEAEKTLHEKDPVVWQTYAHELLRACDTTLYYNSIDASALQRAEAFLRTIGKWKV